MCAVCKGNHPVLKRFIIRPTGECPSNEYNMLPMVECKATSLVKQADSKEETEEDTPLINCSAKVSIVPSVIKIYRNSMEFFLMKNVENVQDEQCESRFEETPSSKPKKSCSIQSFKIFTTALVRWVLSLLLYL